MTYTVPSFESFRDDLKVFFEAQLTGGGYEFPLDAKPWEMATLYYALRERIIPPVPRVVHWSAELQAKRLILTPPIALALATIEAESLAGEDLNPRMSRGQKDVQKHDDLFNHLGILHLHLGVRDSRADGLTVSTPELLFVLVRRDAIYFVDQRLHNVFSGDDAEGLGLLEIVHRNWPQIIQHARFHRAHVLPEDVPSPKDQARLRKAGLIAPMVMSDGTVYGPVGGGVVMCRGKRGRLNGYAVDCANELFNRARMIHEWCCENTIKLVELLRSDSGVTPTSLDNLHLGLDSHGLFIVERTTEAVIRILENRPLVR